jgi:hypothetical protein
MFFSRSIAIETSGQNYPNYPVADERAGETLDISRFSKKRPD